VPNETQIKQAANGRRLCSEPSASTLSPFCNIIMMAPWLFYWAANCIGRLISSFVSSQPSQLEPQEEESYLAGQPGNVALSR